MKFSFAIGAVAGWLLVSLFAGRLLPALSLPTIIAVVVGGIIGQVVGFAVAGGWRPISRMSKSPSLSQSQLEELRGNLERMRDEELLVGITFKSHEFTAKTTDIMREILLSRGYGQDEIRNWHRKKSGEG